MSAPVPPAEAPSEPSLEQQVAAFIDDQGNLSRNPTRVPAPPDDERKDDAPDPAAAVSADAEVTEHDQDQVPENTQDAAAAPDADAEPVEAQGESEVETEMVETVSDLARVFELPEAELLDHLKVPIGEDQVSLAKVIEIAKQPIDVRVNQAVEAHKAEISAKDKERQEAIEQARTSLEEATARVLEGIGEEFGSINWDELRQVDPTEYLVQRQRFEDKKAKANAALTQLRDEEQRQASEEAEARQEWARDERSKLLALPEFSHWATDAEAAKKDLEALGNYLVKDQGLEPDVVSELVDHRLVRIAHKAFLYDQMKQKGKLAVEKVRKAPKMMSSGVRTPPPDPNRKRRAHTQQRLRESGSTEDAAAAIMALGVLDDE